MCSRGQDRQRDDDRRDQRKGLGVRERLEELSLSRFHRKDGKEADDSGGNRCEDRAADLARRSVNHIECWLIALGLL